jgi:hypothetical protein
MRGNVPINLRDACTAGRELLVAREGRVPKWVKSAVLTGGRSLPVYPDKRTFSEAVGMSQRCHEATLRQSPAQDSSKKSRPERRLLKFNAVVAN